MTPSIHKRLNRYWLLFIVVFILHNSEEVFRDLPSWSNHHDLFGIFPNVMFFSLATLVLTIAAATTGYILQRTRSRKSPVVLRIFCWVMLFNAVTHIAGSLYTHTIMPGVLTAVLLILPVYSWLLLQLRKK